MRLSNMLFSESGDRYQCRNDLVVWYNERRWSILAGNSRILRCQEKSLREDCTEHARQGLFQA